VKEYHNKGNKATKTGFGEGLVKAGTRNRSIVALGADITSSVGMNFFAEKFPDRFFSMGIAEQNCVAVAAGMALEGKLPVFATYGVFSALRATDQIRVSLCFNHLRVLIGGAHAGVSVGPDGATHQALEDIAVMRAMPDMTVLSPCDATQTRIATIQALTQLTGPVYLRFGREPMPDFTSDTQKFEIGKAQLMHPGNDISVIATGHLVWEAIRAAYQLKEENIHVRVINLHTIKPIDRETICLAARETGAIVTAEEHQVSGGMGSAVAEVIVQECPVPMHFIGMPDRFGESGSPGELMRKYGMMETDIIHSVKSLLQKKIIHKTKSQVI
jgi:transketolase